MTTSSQVITADGWLEGKHLDVLFFRDKDRLGHWIYAPTTASGGRWCVMTSVEGSDQDWPPSPPLRDFSAHQRPEGGQVALLVGMAGNSHWSASFELSPDDILTVDVACRVRQYSRNDHSSPRLASEYQFSPDAEITDISPASARIACRGEQWILEIDEAFTDRVLLEQPAPDRVRLAVACEDVGRAQTVRWKYRLRHIADSTT